jgi:hypothetical protein
MASVRPKPGDIVSRYTRIELIAIRRDTLRYARLFPPGAERNRHRQIAASLRVLFSNEQWLRDHTVEGLGD